MENIPFWKAILITLGVLVLAGIYIFVGSLFGLEDPWIGFVALTLWSATGMKMEQAPGIFVGGAAGLLISFGIEWLPDVYGDWAVIIPVSAIVLAISCVIKGMLPLVCNFGMFMFLTIATADVFLDQRLQLLYLRDLAYGALFFWMLPWLVIRFRQRGEGGGGTPQAS
ncbi:MAG: hypothetical protein ACR2QU_00480 [Gammaproteobacteria bacterium]